MNQMYCALNHTLSRISFMKKIAIKITKEITNIRPIFINSNSYENALRTPGLSDVRMTPLKSQYMHVNLNIILIYMKLLSQMSNYSLYC